MLLLPFPADITLELLPARLEVAFKKINESTGEKWQPSGALANEVIALRLDHAPLPEVRAKIARVLEARWQGDQLLPDPAATRTRKAILLQKSLATRASSLAYLAKRLGEQPEELTAQDVANTKKKKDGEDALRKDAESRQDWSRVFSASRAAEEIPAWRLAARLAPMLPYSDVRVVYSDIPTPMQRPLPLGAASALDRYRRELKTAGQEPDFTRVRVSIEPWGEGSGTSVYFTALGSDGKTLDTTSIRMNGDSELMNKSGYKEPEIPPGTPLPMSAETLSYFALVNDDYKDKSKRDKVRLRSEWSDRFSHPYELEPLVWQRGEAYVRAAAAMGKQLVARMSDFQNLRYDRNSKWIAPRFLPPIDGTVKEEDGWMILEDRAVDGRIDRQSAGGLITDSLRQGGVTVDSAAAYAVKAPVGTDPFLNWVGDELIALFTGKGAYSALGTTMNENGLRLWGSLSMVQRADLRAGRPVRILNLPLGAREQLRRAIFDIKALEGEPTDLLPNGIEDGTITMKTVETPLTVAWNDAKGPSEEPMPLSAANLGTTLANGSTYWSIPPSEARAWNRFRMGIHRDYKLTIRFDRGPSYDDDLTETLFPPSVKDLSQLPEPFASEVAKARASAKPPKKATEGTVKP